MKIAHRFIVFFIELIQIVHSTHYRGSMLTWRVVNSTSNPLTIELFHRHTWSYTWYPCTSAQIKSGNHTIGTGNGSGNITCATPCPLNGAVITSVAAPCTAANSIENYSVNEGRYNISVSSNKTFRVLFAAGDWFTLITGGKKWSVCTEINTYKRSNGKYNHAPIVTMLPIMRLRLSLSYQVKINVADNDFDRYVCIWSNSTQECGEICRPVLTLPTGTFLNETSCVLHITPNIVGYYALAVTVLDYENTTSATPLSRVPIQFILRIWSTATTCSTPPVYIGDAPGDQCIFVEPDKILTIFIRIRVQCANATLANVIGVAPAGFTQSDTFVDPYYSNVYIYKVTYVANINQVGQNLYCFAGVDSIGNQGDSTCLRFTVQISSESQNSLYINNATRFPTGLVSKFQSIWTILYPTGTTFTRPNTKTFIRFKIQSTKDDFLAYNVVTETTNVDYQTDRLVIRTNIEFTAGEKYFISLDPGVFLPISTCLRDSMGLTDPLFWTFEIASEPNTTTITTTTTTSVTTEMTTARNRTIPTIRTLSTTIRSSTTKITTTAYDAITEPLTTVKTILPSYSFPIAGIVGIILGLLIFITIVLLILKLKINHQLYVLSKSDDSRAQLFDISAPAAQYKLTTHAASQMDNYVSDTNNRYVTRLVEASDNHLASIEC